MVLLKAEQHRLPLTQKILAETLFKQIKMGTLLRELMLMLQMLDIRLAEKHLQQSTQENQLVLLTIREKSALLLKSLLMKQEKKLLNTREPAVIVGLVKEEKLFLRDSNYLKMVLLVLKTLKIHLKVHTTVQRLDQMDKLVRL
jgi:hypothetical protein